MRKTSETEESRGTAFGQNIRSTYLLAVLLLALSGCTTTVTGSVRDNFGKPVQAAVAVGRSGKEATRANSNGEFTLELKRKEWHFNFSALGYSQANLRKRIHGDKQELETVELFRVPKNLFTSFIYVGPTEYVDIGRVRLHVSGWGRRAWTLPASSKLVQIKQAPSHKFYTGLSIPITDSFRLIRLTNGTLRSPDVRADIVRKDQHVHVGRSYNDGSRVLFGIKYGSYSGSLPTGRYCYIRVMGVLNFGAWDREASCFEIVG